MTRLTLKSAPKTRLSLAGLTPDKLAGLSLGEIEALPISVGNRHDALGDWFAVSAGEPGRIEIEGTTERFDRIGCGLAQGEIIVEGEAGAYLGQGMTGGTITVRGPAGYGAGVAMTGGKIEISGNAGDFAGGALSGERIGMAGGLIVIHGSAGDRLGDRMSRGLIVVAGSAGESAASRLNAGSIVVGGSVGPNPGIAMHKGSLVALGGIAGLPATFGDSGVQDLVVFRLWARHLDAIGLGAIGKRIGLLRRWVGDLAVSGLGEILVAE
jgi:formylmethanofuran dehydrogenase subunit C